MNVEKKELSRGQVELKIELTADEYQPFLKQAALDLSERLEISGFRKGKAPYEVIKQQVGEVKLWEEAIEFAVNKTLFETLRREKLITVGSPKIEVEKLAPGNDVIYKATLSLLPTVELGNLEEIKVEKKAIKIEDGEIRQTLKDLQNMRGKEILVDRAAQEGDKVIINFTGYLDKVPLEGGEQKNFPIILGDNHFIPGFEKNLVGLRKDDEKEFKIKFPENYHQRNLAGRLVEFRTRLVAVYEIQLPELNDEFAKNIGQGFNHLADLKNQIRQGLQREGEQRENQRLEDSIINQLIDASQFTDIPDLLISSEAQTMVNELEQTLVNQALKFDDYLKHLNKKRSDLLLDFTPTAVRRIKTALIMRQVVAAQNLKVSDAELEAEIQKLLQAHPHNQKLAEQVKNLEYRSYLRNILASRQVMEFLKGKMVQ